MNTATNARLWVFYNNSFVKLTLKPGQALSFGKSEATDEGWTFYGETLAHDGAVITRACTSDGTDCDGRHGWTCDLECKPSDLGAYEHIEPDGTIYRTPVWQRVNEEHYDQFAQEAGY